MSIITISRGIKSGGEKLAHHLAEKLGYKCLGHEIVYECAKKYNIMEQDLLSQLEETPSLWQRLKKEHSRFLIYLQCSLIEAVKQNNIIYHDNAGQLFLKGMSHVLKIRLEAPFEDRVETVMRESGKDYEKAVEYINNVDQKRERWVKFLYDENWYSPSLYDLSFNLKNMSIDTISEIIILTINRKEFKTSDKSIKQLNNLSLECEIKAAIASDDKIWDQPITVSADNGEVILRGTVKNNKMRDLIEDITRKVKGITSCQVNINLITDPLARGMLGHD